MMAIQNHRMALITSPHLRAVHDGDEALKEENISDYVRCFQV